MDKRNILRENRNLKHQLEVAQQELKTIKTSRAFTTIRMLGNAKNQFRRSPANFAKKAIKKILISKGGRLKSLQHVSKNILSTIALQDEYKEWIVLNEPDAEELRQQSKNAQKFRKKPLISIITPVFNPPAHVLDELIQSVLNQTYPNFELCLGNFGDDSAVAHLLNKYAKEDSRVKNWLFSENKGIAANSNRILAKSKGEYIALLDHDDTLSPDALYENIKAINENDYDFLYSDKDKIDEAGNRFEPFFKPDWSPEIMLNANYLTHLNIMKASLVKAVGGWSSDTDGAQDWDLFLKLIAVSKRIAHIPKVLYHWRVISTSTAMSIETKPYALQGQRVAVDKYLQTKGINASSYHTGAEILLEWPKRRQRNIFMAVSSLTALYKICTEIAKSNTVCTYYLFHNFTLPEQFEIPAQTKLIGYHSKELTDIVCEELRALREEEFLWASENTDITMLSALDLDNLLGWLSIDGVIGAGPRLVEYNSKVAIDCGALVTTEGLRPIFWNSPPYHQTPIGNIEWVRNLKVASSHLLAIKKIAALEVLKKSRKGKAFNIDFWLVELQLNLAKQGRVVLNPKVFAQLRKGVTFDAPIYYAAATYELQSLLPSYDGYSNINLSASDPMHLVKIVQDSSVDEESTPVAPDYQLEALTHALNNSLTNDELKRNENLISTNSKDALLGQNQKVLLILPGFEAIYAGLNNIFTFADKLRQKGQLVSFAFMVQAEELIVYKNKVSSKFPELAEAANFIATSVNEAESLPESDIAICTQWATAYVLARYNNTKRKCYFIQDKEASFYPKGTISALVENTYKFGFWAIANTPGLLEWYKHQYGGSGVVLKSVVNLDVYAPDVGKPLSSKTPHRVFFYARPNEPRNAFELGIAALIRLKKQLGDDVEIYTAGAHWDPGMYGVEDVLTNLGKIAYDKIPAFYRSMDVGLMFMFSGHPGVVASELMASGCPVVVNEYDDATWRDLYQHEKTCLVSKPTADAVAYNLRRCLTETELRKQLINGGLAKATHFYDGYQQSFDHVIETIIGEHQA